MITALEAEITVARNAAKKASYLAEANEEHDIKDGLIRVIEALDEMLMDLS